MSSVSPWNAYFVLTWLNHYFSGVGVWVGENENKVHLSPAEAEIRAELGKKAMKGVSIDE